MAGNIGRELNFTNWRSGIGLPNSLHDVIHCMVVQRVTGLTLRAEVIASNTTQRCSPYQSVHTVLECSRFILLGTIHLAFGSSVLPVSSTQLVTLSFTAFRSVSIGDANSQLCFPGRP